MSEAAFEAAAEAIARAKCPHQFMFGGDASTDACAEHYGRPCKCASLARAAIEAYEAAAWQPIETAPTSGPHILVLGGTWQGEHGDTQELDPNAMTMVDAGRHFVVGTCFYSARIVGATHWRRLPPVNAPATPSENQTAKS